LGRVNVFSVLLFYNVEKFLQLGEVTMKQILEEVENIAKKLLKKSPLAYENLNNIPVTQGVYLIYGEGNKVIYVGKGRNLKRRILNDHISAESGFTTSIFRRKISKLYDIKTGRQMKEWIVNNCLFAWIEIADKDKASLTEELIIAYLRDKTALINS